MRHYDLPPLAQLEAFEAAARTLSFTKAADELSLTQSAISRQIKSLEEHLEVTLFRRLHRALRLTEEGQTLYQAVGEVLAQLHDVAGRLRRRPENRTVVVTTTPGFAGVWLIPRLTNFTTAHPQVDVRISAGNSFINLERDGVDLAIRYKTREGVGEPADRLFGEVIFPVCSPRLLRDPARPLKTPADLRHHTLLHMEPDAAGVLQSWAMWLRALKLETLTPASVVHFSMYDQMIQATMAGQGVALGRSPLIDSLLRQRKLVAPFSQTMASPRSYYLVQSAAALRKPEVQSFIAWLRREAQADADAAPAGDSLSGGLRSPGRDSARSRGRATA
jgi:DNA-binding transcriptional LysR family regulator